MHVGIPEFYIFVPPFCKNCTFMGRTILQELSRVSVLFHFICSWGRRKTEKHSQTTSPAYINACTTCPRVQSVLHPEMEASENAFPQLKGTDTLATHPHLLSGPPHGGWRSSVSRPGASHSRKPNGRRHLGFQPCFLAVEFAK